MSDKTEMVSVPRHLIDNAINYMEGSASATVLVWRDRLIDAMEAAPAEDVRAVVEEPVYQSRFHWNDIWLDLDKATFEARSTDPNTYVTRALFSHPQRPVVLPERKDPDNSMSEPYDPDSWNACLNAVEELNK